jgi:hypothetical protein
VVFVLGESDYNHADAEVTYGRLRAGHRWCRLMRHPGGHTLGRPRDLESALKHLAAAQQRTG